MIHTSIAGVPVADNSPATAPFGANLYMLIADLSRGGGLKVISSFLGQKVEILGATMPIWLAGGILLGVLGPPITDLLTEPARRRK